MTEFPMNIWDKFRGRSCQNVTPRVSMRLSRLGLFPFPSEPEVMRFYRCTAVPYPCIHQVCAKNCVSGALRGGDPQYYMVLIGTFFLIGGGYY